MALTVEYAKRPVALPREIHYRGGRQHRFVFPCQRRDLFVSVYDCLARGPPVEVQDQLREVGGRRTEAQTLEIRKTNKGSPGKVNVRRPQIPVTQGRYAASYRGDGREGLLRPA